MYSRTLIDHVFSNFDVVHSSTQADFKISDHETIFVHIENGQNRDDSKVKIKCWRRYSKQAMSQLVARSLDFPTMAGDLDDKALILTDTLKVCTNNLVSEKYVDLNSSNCWYSLDLRRLKRKRDKWYRKFRTTNNEIDWQQYTTARNVYSRALKNTRYEYIQRKIDQHQNNSKELWKILKNLINVKSNSMKTITFAGVEEHSGSTIAKKFNSYFVTSVQQINQSIDLVCEPTEITQPID